MDTALFHNLTNSASVACCTTGRFACTLKRFAVIDAATSQERTMATNLVVTGLGVVSAIGQGKQDFTAALLAGRSAFGVMQRPGRASRRRTGAWRRN